jgi:adenosyl cobinamide kinase/adenosyl cobinamide phosphate guanylyltransferase
VPAINVRLARLEEETSMKLPSKLLTLFMALVLLPLTAMAQRRNSLTANSNTPEPLSVEQQDALELLRTLARNLKSEPDKLAAGRLLARIADELWVFDEAFARESFRWSFDAVCQPLPADLPKANQSTYLAQQASAVKEVLRRFGAHDSKRAQAWLKAFENEELSKASAASGSDRSRFELFMQIAVQLATTDPEQATRLGLVSLSGTGVPEGFGSLLFSVGHVNRKLSDELFRAAIATLRRNNYVNDTSLIVLANYLFSAGGELHSNAAQPDAQLLANYYVDAAWHQGGGDGRPVPPASAGFYSVLETRAVPIVSRFAPDRLPELRGQMSRIASGLTQEQAQRTELLRSTQQQQATVAGRNNYTIDEQIERALKEKDVQVRDALLNSIAHVLMRQDFEQALNVAKKIDDVNLRTTAEDDINLLRIQQLLHSQSYDEARKISSSLNNQVFRAKILTQLAAKVWSSTKDGGQSSELLSAAINTALKSEDSPDKVIALLHVVEQFARFDSIQAFEALATAITTLNRLKSADKESPRAASAARPPLLRIKSYTVINGMEMTSSNDATLDSIDFSQIGSLALHDYMQTRLLASKIDKPLQRANYLAAVAGSVLKSEKRRAFTSSKN